MVQRRGNVFYDVAPRDLGKLRVETPLLVAVIKGTQFNVAVQPDSTTISLFEGRLEIRTPDNNDVVQLNA
ncbi:MAG TPA: FecR domain-containing protein, partial [Gammaproteobacteria bacterium]|nr:FecR domain-containing protein [Gammaproteobacteria bacterium]